MPEDYEPARGCALEQYIPIVQSLSLFGLTEADGVIQIVFEKKEF